MKKRTKATRTPALVGPRVMVGKLLDAALNASDDTNHALGTAILPLVKNWTIADAALAYHCLWNAHPEFPETDAGRASRDCVCRLWCLMSRFVLGADSGTHSDRIARVTHLQNQDPDESGSDFNPGVLGRALRNVTHDILSTTPGCADKYGKAFTFGDWISKVGGGA